MTREQLQAAARAAAEATGSELVLDARLAPLLSLRVGGAVPALVRPRDARAVSDVVRALQRGRVPHRVLGGGSNLLAADEGLDFVVVHVGAASGPAEWDGVRVRAAAGTSLGALLRESLARGAAGLEWAAGLPGTVGGAVAGNAGAFGSDMAASVREAVLLGPDGTLRTHVVAPGDFGYRRSFVRPGETVLEVVLELRASTPEAVRAEADRVNRQRAASQPKGGHSAGCMFKNPPEGPAGRILDELGLKGRRRGGASISTAHANFVVNDGTATASDVLGLIEEARREVRERRGIELELEVKVWTGGGSP